MQPHMRVFDAHLHIIDPRFPLIPNQGYVPDAFTDADYRRAIGGFELTGGAVVAGSFQGFDPRAVTCAVADLGAGFVGVAQLPPDTTDAQILSLAAAGIRAVRFNVHRGGADQLTDLESFARRVHELARWHVELYVDSRVLGDIAERVARLPSVSIDHLGLSGEGLPTLLTLAERGVRVKATGFGRVDFDVRQALRDFWTANPHCLMFGTDLPSTRARRPYSHADLQLVVDTFDPEAAGRILFGNAASFYRSGEG